MFTARFLILMLEGRRLNFV